MAPVQVKTRQSEASSSYPTEQIDWDSYWNNVSLPSEVQKIKGALYLNEILNVLDRYFPRGKGLSALEIGGAPGKWSVYLAKNFGYEVHCLDCSSVGCRKTRENFDLLNIHGHVHQGDLFSESIQLPLFDVVYSFGFIEHFQDMNFIVQKHLELLKLGGTLLIGSPNFLGVNHWFLKKLSPSSLIRHNLSAMDISNWKGLEDKLGLKPVFKGYVGGFEPAIFCECENKTFWNSVWYEIARILCLIFHSHFKILRKLNGRWLSGYVIGVYKKPT